jgi:hypothetical protein
MCVWLNIVERGSQELVVFAAAPAASSSPLHTLTCAAMASTLASSSARPLLRLSRAAAPVRAAGISTSQAAASQPSGIAIGSAGGAASAPPPFAQAQPMSDIERRRNERRAQLESMTEEQRHLAQQKLRKRVGESARAHA